MPNFNKSVDELETRFDKWHYVLKNLHKLEKLPDKLEEKVFERVFKVAEIGKFSCDKQLAYEDSLNYYCDLKNSFDTVKYKSTLEIAKRLLINNVDLDMISNSTGLTKDQIEKLRDN